jgi:hypothetical protein
VCQENHLPGKGAGNLFRALQFRDCEGVLMKRSRAVGEKYFVRATKQRVEAG